MDMKKRILLRITSTKFWAFLAVFVVAVYMLFQPGVDTKVQIAAVITALGDVVCYTCGNIASKAYNPENENKGE